MAYAHELTQEPDSHPQQSRDDGGDPLKLHTENLFDENNDAFGNIVNEATGEPFDNSTETDKTIIESSLGRVVTDSEIDIDPSLGDLDATDQWLQQVEADPAALEAATDAWLKHHGK